VADIRRNADEFSRVFGKFLVDTGENVTEEKIEQVLGRFDLNHLLDQESIVGTLARLAHAIPADARLVGLNLLASYVDMKPDINPVVKFGAISFLRALPQAIPLMFSEASPKMEQMEKKLEQQRQLIHADTDKRQAYVGPKRTDYIHDAAFHPPEKDAVVNRGKLLDILTRFDRNPFCPDCFRKELASGRVKIEIVPKGPRKGRGYAALADFGEDERFYFEAIETLAQLEVDKDLGLGHEGEASHILAAHTFGLDNDPIALRKMIPNGARKDAEDMIRLSTLSREEIEGLKKPDESLLPLSARLYVRRILAAYRVDHPTSNTEVRLKDWKDGLFDSLPPGLKPKKKGWAGVWETICNPIVFLLLFIALLFFSILGYFILAAVIGWLIYAYDAVRDSVVATVALFQTYMTGWMMIIQKGLVVGWVALVLLPIIAFFVRFEGVRPRVQTVRLLLSAVGFGTALLGWGLGHFTHTGVAIITIAIWLILVIVEFSNKYGGRMSSTFVSKGSERFVTWGGAIAGALLFLGVVYFATVGARDAERVAALSSGVANSVQNRIADAAGIRLPPSDAECIKGLEVLDLNLKHFHMTRAEYCATAPYKNDVPCTCL